MRNHHKTTHSATKFAGTLLIALTLLGFCALVATPALSSTGGPLGFPGSYCEDDSQCRSNQVCENNRCVLDISPPLLTSAEDLSAPQFTSEASGEGKTDA